MRFSFAAASVRGTKRHFNADAACGTASLLAVADGMGTEGAAVAINALVGFAGRAARLPTDESIDPSSEYFALEAAACAHRAMVDQCHHSGDQLVTNLTMLTCSGTGLGLLHTGITRAYFLRGEELFQITNDHTLCSFGYEPPTIEQRFRAVVYRVLDGKCPWEEMNPDHRRRSFEPGDRYLLCSDGLAIPIDAEDIWAALLNNPTPEGAVHDLMEAGRRSGSPDNMTCVVADLTEDGNVPSPIRVGAAAGT
jgi:serine/threonine protein phosphatase PrpC